VAVEERDLGGFSVLPIKRTLLLGMGNPILSDDAIGIRLVSLLKKKLTNISALDVVEDCSLGGVNLLEVIEGYDRLIVVDSIQTAGATAGQWHYFTADRLRETMNLNCIHDVNFATALELGRRLGMHLPADQDIHVFAVEILDNLTFGEQMSEAMENRLPALVEEIYAHLDFISRGTNDAHLLFSL
jgi:hydrogenase maturation protease